ncbi:MAG: hypothetical protein ABSG31_14825 [Tepidisphaeraceae bacterium]|jgi:hypothetical protein
MAKAKKPSKPVRTKPASKPEPGIHVNTPAIDSDAAAAAAAAIVGRKLAPPLAGGTESSSFRNLKESLIKPHSQTIGGLLDKFSSGGNKKSGQPFMGGKQVGHNQTFGADANRKNIPRRTGG